MNNNNPNVFSYLAGILTVRQLQIHVHCSIAFVKQKWRLSSMQCQDEEDVVIYIKIYILYRVYQISSPIGLCPSTTLPIKFQNFLC